MTFDMNDVAPQQSGDLIPDGTFAKVTMTIRKGGTDGMSEVDRGLLKPSNQPGSDVLMLDAEFTVAEGPHARRKFWQNFTVQGGKLDEQGQSIGWKISKSTFRAMIDSALGLNPEDMSDAAKAKRVLRGLADLDGISFVAKIQVEPSRNPAYRDANKLDHVVLPTAPEWQKVMAGETVPAQPSNRPRPAAAPAQAATPAWGQPQAPSAPTAPAWAAPAAQPASPAPRSRAAPKARRRPGLAEPVSPDEWQAHVTHGGGPGDGPLARGAGAARPPHRQPDAARSRMHGDNAISRFVVLASERRTAAPDAAGARRAGPAADGLTRAELARRVPCALCGREARGFGYCHGLRWDRHPYHRFCSMACLTAGSANARRNHGMIDKTDMEARAIREARRAARRGADRDGPDGALLRPPGRGHRPRDRGLRRRLPGLDAAPVRRRRVPF